MSDRVVILSDMHLGRPRHAAVSAQALRPLWRGAAELIVNGDAAEVHHPRHAPRASDELGQLRELCEKDGVRLSFIAGNHDPIISPARHLELADGRVFITHGDVLHDAIAPWSPNAARLRKVRAQALRSLRAESVHELSARLEAARQASRHVWVDHPLTGAQEAWGMLLRLALTPARIIAYWNEAPRLIAAFLRLISPDARFVILGHTHWAGLWHIDGRVVINTGAFGFPPRARAVVIEDGLLSVHRVELSRRMYRLDSPVVARYALDAPLSAPAETPSALNTRPVSLRPSVAAM